MSTLAGVNGDAIDITGLVPDITGLVPDVSGMVATNVVFTNTAATSSYKSQQYQMQQTQYGTQLDIMTTLQPQTSAVQAEAQALKEQSATETVGIKTEQSNVLSAQSEQIQAQETEHLNGQLVQQDISVQVKREKELYTADTAQLGVAHQQAHIASTGTQYDIISQTRQDQLGSLDAARKQQLLMLQQQHSSTGMTLVASPGPYATPNTPSYQVGVYADPPSYSSPSISAPTYASSPINSFSTLGMHTTSPFANGYNPSSYPSSPSPYSSHTPVPAYLAPSPSYPSHVPTIQTSSPVDSDGGAGAGAGI